MFALICHEQAQIALLSFIWKQAYYYLFHWNKNNIQEMWYTSKIFGIVTVNLQLQLKHFVDLVAMIKSVPAADHFFAWLVSKTIHFKKLADWMSSTTQDKRLIGTCTQHICKLKFSSSHKPTHFWDKHDSNAYCSWSLLLCLWSHKTSPCFKSKSAPMPYSNNSLVPLLVLLLLTHMQGRSLCSCRLKAARAWGLLAAQLSYY